MQPAEAGKAPPPKAGAAFRETLWFKKGDVEQMVADAKAKLQAAGTKRTDSAELGEDARPLEDRYVDDGSVTVEDRKKFSLRTGGTATAMPSVGAAVPSVPGQKMDERELVGEIGSGRRTLILVIAAAVILALVVVVAMMVKGKGKGSAATSTATMTVSQQASGPTTEQFAAVPPDADIAAGTGAAAANSAAAAAPGAPPGRTTGSALGNTGGSTKPGVGGATGEAKATAQTKKQVKKKPIVKHAKHKR
jgi:hypothetical protein